MVMNPRWAGDRVCYSRSCLWPFGEVLIGWVHSGLVMKGGQELSVPIGSSRVETWGQSSWGLDMPALGRDANWS